jgi:siroheme synthase-like protein
VPRYYPVMLDIEGARCLVVGAGEVAKRKIASLVACGADVFVIAPKATRELMGLARGGGITLLTGPFYAAYLAGASLVIAATDDPETNRLVSDEARRRGIPVNVVDQPELCSFIVPAVVERGPVTMSVSTGGASPALAKWLRRRLEEAVGPEVGELAALLGELRDEVKARHPGEPARRAVYEAILDSDALDLLRAGRAAEARERVLACISSPSG